jgi:hypothetical protein
MVICPAMAFIEAVLRKDPKCQSQPLFEILPFFELVLENRWTWSECGLARASNRAGDVQVTLEIRVRLRSLHITSCAVRGGVVSIGILRVVDRYWSHAGGEVQNMYGRRLQEDTPRSAPLIRYHCHTDVARLVYATEIRDPLWPSTSGDTSRACCDAGG